MTAITFDVAVFRATFPEFADSDLYPTTPLLQNYWNIGICYISPENCGYLNGDCRVLALNMMVAHLTKINALILVGKTPMVVTGSTIGSVLVTLQPPPINTDMWAYWLSSTPYGKQLYVLLQMKGAAGGGYIGGTSEIPSIRKGGGIW